MAGIYMITPGKLLIYKKVYGEWQGWYVVEYNGQTGYAAAAFIEIP